MKQINGIVFILIAFGFTAWAKPTSNESSTEPIIVTQENVSTKSLTKSDDIIIEPELIVIPKIEKIPLKELEVQESENLIKSSLKMEASLNNKESSRNVEVSKEEPSKTTAVLAEEKKKEEDHKFKDSPSDVGAEEIHKQSEVWKDFENNFDLLEHRMPDLTEEEFDEINKDGGTPWNFLKSVVVKKKVNKVEPLPQSPSISPIYITVPIVINSHSTLPISLSIGGQEVPLNIGSNTQKPVLNYTSPPPRETNRHRSNLRQKIYARNNNHQVEAFEYKKENV